ncbi:ScyD/ScyE family protein [Actinotalea sp. M2MS4P-6]|uniref:ScyD/ScyE family protein n=1 Tax=Actinotalea sp. M2MS4P-6 TaxID=2983762 RepID=UPI0021E38701|nr:ScyD/ScyE family protein [Actinotalea sp. M2MS4P-6]MCV2395971.1 ScyD/ScyE family protein [Actinotalea sp. M2MS4P-6]
MKIAIAATTALLLLLPAGAAVGAPKTDDPTVLADNLIGPLHLDIGPGRTATVSQEFAGLLTSVDRKGTDVIYANPEWDVAGVDHRGTTRYVLISQGAGQGDPTALAGALLAIDRKGHVRTVTDQLAELETSTNPDAVNSYGLSADDAAANPACVAALAGVGAPASYTGALDSHPYAIAVKGHTAYIADAGANTIVKVDLRNGAASTLAVLPPQPALITDEGAAALGVADCAGLTYAFEPVPTDVVIGPDGAVYVSTLPGGPESPALGARGAVYRVDTSTGAESMVLGGILTPTGIAFDGDGALYIASLFGEGVYKVPVGSTTPVLVMPAPLAADVEIHGSTLYATINALGAGGQLVSMHL